MTPRVTTQATEPVTTRGDGGRILLFGATGYTGRLTAHALARRGVPLALVSRSATRASDVARECAENSPTATVPEVAVADAHDARSIRHLITGPGYVLISTVGPFLRLGTPAVEAAIDAGARYVDSTGEGPFIRRIFEHYGPAAKRTGATLLTAFGYDYVPGNLAGALALRDAGDAGAEVRRLEIGYFVTGPMRMSSGTRASIAGVMIERSHGFRDSRIVSERTGARTMTFADAVQVHNDQIDAISLAGLTIGATEQFTLPRLAPSLRSVDVFLGWAGAGSERASRQAGILNAALTLPGARPLARRIVRSRTPDTTGVGPDAQRRAGARTLVIARALDDAGTCRAVVQVDGPSPYELTGELLAWAGHACLTSPALAPGALGPVDAFGLAEVEQSCAQLGLRRASDSDE